MNMKHVSRGNLLEAAAGSAAQQVATSTTSELADSASRL